MAGIVPALGGYYFHAQDPFAAHYDYVQGVLKKI